jgi:hypothetical protein
VSDKLLAEERKKERKKERIRIIIRRNGANTICLPNIIMISTSQTHHFEKNHYLLSPFTKVLNYRTSNKKLCIFFKYYGLSFH